MSYEGSIELLCGKGHYSVINCYSDEPEKCSCGGKFTHRHSIDETNGVIAKCPSTMPAKKTKIGKEEKVIQIPLFSPGRGWRKI